jgi:SAM-dependent methyltransferase
MDSIGRHSLASGLVELFACPRCGAEDAVLEDDRIMCGGCGSEFPIVDGIPRFVESLDGGIEQVQRVFDFEHRRFQNSSYTRFSPDLVDQFLADCRLPADFFPGRAALDAGCGSGRWSYALSELEAKLTACDLTLGGLEAVKAELGDRPTISLCQANIFALPFRAEAFDFVMSWGVLHHTPDTRAAFDRLVPLVKPGGTLYVMVYERHSPVMFAGTNVVRWFLRRMADERRYRFCRHLVIRNRMLARLLAPFLMISYHDPAAGLDVETLQFGLFDAYSPRYNHLHTQDEVLGWFRESGFPDAVVVESAKGAVKVRGTKAR